ncbi:MAG: hypothetical protein US11_C0001G0157 [Candidatus Roizmanbacteria bacterium GW2011_GWA2_36_23]|uniref:Baseplate protein J-like domain-containing protein n=1 Tax=Candidatus Roizmanbacteria bacterium GW2011_GWA2_36_23 TaxID=1618480 RepID=A0A0G0E5J9_9BACT|nr:MAG: hypothetical protein US11_C0001G0157 [Candidatus Roizmanbacteria bacterium GW2011_GWA2_36_23]
MKFPFFAKAVSAEIYFGLFLKEQEGIGIIMAFENGNITIKHTEKFTYSNGWEHLVEDIDELLLNLEKNNKYHVEKTIFFVYSHFIDSQTKNIKKPYLQKIKQIINNLELKPLGYIECSDAVVHYLQEKNETPLTAILVELDKTDIGVMIYKGGRLSYSKNVSRTDNLIEDLLTSFQELKGTFLLPSRIILYNSKDLADESTKIITYRWDDEYFVQIPRVEVLREEEVLEGLSKIFARQINRNEPNISIPDETVHKNVMGFVIGEDIKVKAEVKKEKKTPFKFPTLPSIPSMPSLQYLLKNVLNKKMLIIFGLAIIFFSMVLNEYLLHKARIKLIVMSQKINKSLPLTISADSVDSVDLKIREATISSEFSLSKPTTGKREIGDKAAGEVTIFSFDDKERQFAKGTLIANSNLQFVLEEDVRTASASISINNETVPGKNKVKIKAVSIGPEANLEKGKRFKIGDLSQTIYYAINDTPFSGGSKKTVKTVSKDDLQELQENMLKTAKQTMRSKLKLRAGDRLLDDLSDISISDIQYSKELGEEGNIVNSKAEIHYGYKYYEDNQMKNKLIGILQKEITKGLTLSKDTVHYKIDSAKESKNELDLEISVNAKAIQSLDKEAISRQIRFKTKNQVNRILKEKYRVLGYELEIKNPVPFLSSITPFFQNNVQITISGN